MKKTILVLSLLFASLTSSQTTDVWDFGATQLDAVLYTNRLNVSTINSWYPNTISPGSVSTANTLPTSFTSGALTWVGASSDRLRSTNTAITRYDNNIASVTTYTGRVYCNGNASLVNGLPTSRYFALQLNEDDEVICIARGDTAGLLSFVYQSNPSLQSDSFPITSISGSITEAKFVAKQAGTYLFFDTTSKVSFYRILRKNAVYTTVTGTIDLALANNIPDGYSIVFTNNAGKSWTAQLNSGTYSVNVPLGYSYSISIANANGYIISSGATFDATSVTSPTVNHPIALAAVNLFTATGTISGLGTSISSLLLTFTADPTSGSVFVPSPVIDYVNNTYSVQLVPGVQYTIEAQGVNDYELLSNSITIDQNTTVPIAFSAKTVYPITITTSGLTSAQQSNLQLLFSNNDESGYSYTFTNLAAISLRNGTYKITASGLDADPVALGLTSNLVVANAAVSKSLSFQPVTVWSFDDKAINTSTTAFYKGMQLNGQITTVVASGHLTAKTGATIIVPVQPNESVLIYYYYTANFSIAGGPTITTATNSTSLVENTHYVYTGTTPGTVTIQVGGLSTLTSYFTEIKVIPTIAFSPTITVGTNKTYQTISAALEAVSYMTRPNNQRVTLLIDSGNYEEMLVVNVPNITLKNADSYANTTTTNAGVNIAPGAVRITSYYGHGYHYYSMNTKQKWDQEVLRVSLENGNYTNTNAGAGTTNGSYWNATVVVSASGFEAEQIIFENSFNQYISQKEAQDVVVAWPSGSPGNRPTAMGTTLVQNRSFVERAAAIAFVNNTDKAILNKCKIIGRQDSFFGGSGARVVVYKGAVMGAVDFIFGGMTAVFYQTDLIMNTSDTSSDVSYITAAQQTTGRGYLMYECNVTSTIPTIETASVHRSKPGYFGRPWQANTSEVVFYKTTIETSNYPGFNGNSLIMPAGWLNTLGGTSSGMYEYGSSEISGVDNRSFRASWATTLNTAVLLDSTVINPFNFTKGTDDWDPIPELVNKDTLHIQRFHPENSVAVFSASSAIYIQNVTGLTSVTVYDLSGIPVKSLEIIENTNFTMPKGLWIVKVTGPEGVKATKVITK